MKPIVTLVALASVAALGAVAVTISIGASLREQTVVKDPYQRGIQHDQERQARERLGWQARFDAADLQPGGAAVGFTLVDKAGAPVEGAEVQVAVTRPAGPGDERQGTATALGGGRYQAPVGFAAPGFWDVRLDARRGGDQVGVTQQVRIEAAAGAPCDLAAAPCQARAGRLAVTLDLGRVLATMKELPVTVAVTRGGAPLEGASVEVSFAMKEMNMGENRIQLAAAGPGRHAGKGVLVRCHSGRRDWIATVTVRPAGGASESAAFPFTVKE
jgi:nitrogen fixation protein FixH